MSYSNYRNNMPHYNSMPYNCDPMDLSYAPGMPPYGNTYMASNYYPSMPFMTNNTMPTMPNIPNMPMISEDYMPDMPFISDSEMNSISNNTMTSIPRRPAMPPMPNGTMPSMPGMPEFNLPNGDLPAMPAMPGMPADGNFYPGTQVPEMNNGTMPMQMTCEQLMEMMRRMNCNMDHMGDMNSNTQNRTTNH